MFSDFCLVAVTYLISDILERITSSTSVPTVKSMDADVRLLYKKVTSFEEDISSIKDSIKPIHDTLGELSVTQNTLIFSYNELIAILNISIAFFITIGTFLLIFFLFKYFLKK